MIIDRHAVKDYLGREFDDWRWMKRLLREEITRELSALRVQPRFKTKPWLHQLVCFFIALSNPRFLFLLDMGLGKSKILMDIITQLMREKRITRALITVPRLINIESWLDDIEVHSNLDPWTINGPDIEEKRERLLNPKGDVTLIDYQGLTWALCDKVKAKGGKSRLEWNEKHVRRAQELYGYIGIDESHKLTNHESLWYAIMWQLTKRADYVYATTGTLFGHDPHEAWSQFKLVDSGETFGTTMGLFRAGLFTKKMNPWKGEVFTFDKNRSRKLTEMLQHRSIRYDEDEVQDLPKLTPRTVLCAMGAEQEDAYLEALEGLINAGGKLADLEAPWLRMRQIISGYRAWNDDYGSHFLPFDQNPKMDQTERLVDEMGDTKMVICYDYTQTGQLIVNRMEEMKVGFEWFYGGTKDKPASRRRFMENEKCRVFVMNSSAGGEGNDGLQKVARYMLFYETPTSPRLRQQTIKRIHRPGQEFRSFVYDLVMQKSLDKGILERIQAGIDLHDNVVNGRNNLDKKFFRGSL